MGVRLGPAAPARAAPTGRPKSLPLGGMRAAARA